MDSQFLLEFLKDHIDIQKPIGLAYSGGVDSQALYQFLLEINQINPLQLHILHINHNWREESKKQAEDLQKRVFQDGLKFHRKDLPLPSSSANLEEKGRLARLQFFQEITKKHSLQAVLLAHHKDDLAETVLKKVLEGSHLVNIPFRPSQIIDGVLLLRPLLDIPKQKLRLYLSKKQVPYLEDPTNRDEKYLRARLRKQVLPKLSQDFGKNVVNNLAELSDQCDEFLSYFRQRLSCPEKISGPFGDIYDFKGLALTHLLEWKVLIILVLKKEGIFLPKKRIESIARFLSQQSANKRIKQGNVELILDRGILFILKKNIEPPKSLIPLKESPVFLGPFKLLFESTQILEEENIGWKSIWGGKALIYIPNKRCFLASCSYLHAKDKKRIYKRWSDRKIPAFLRKLPVIVSEDGNLIGDLLSFRTRGKDFIAIKIKFESSSISS